jgi:methyltransferase (TIGR00027 family)
MEKTKTSTTAQGIAMIRALESEKPPGKRICYDPFAQKFVDPWFYLLGKIFAGSADRRSPGFVGFVVSRCRYIDDYLEKCLRGNIAQVVILGAGLDSRAYRFAIFKGPVKVFEVDQPGTQEAKIARVKKVFGEVPSFVTYVPIDFNKESLDKLSGNGYDRSQTSLFILEGVTPYLKAEAVDSTLGWVRFNAASGSSIIFDYIYTSALTAEHRHSEVERMRRTQRFTGEALVFGIEKTQIEDFLTRFGFIRVVNASAEDFKRLYFTGLNQDRPIADIYSIVHAMVP